MFKISINVYMEKKEKTVCYLRVLLLTFDLRIFRSRFLRHNGATNLEISCSSFYSNKITFIKINMLCYNVYYIFIQKERERVCVCVISKHAYQMRVNFQDK